MAPLPPRSFTEGFEDYVSGDYVSVVSDYYPGPERSTDGDLQITDEAFESLNSQVEQPQPEVLATCCWTCPPRQLSLTGRCWSKKALRPISMCTDAPGAGTDSWQLNCAIDAQGAALSMAPGAGGPVNVTIGSWFEVRVVVDLDQGLASFGRGPGGGPIPLRRQLSSVNFFAFGDGTTTGFYYVDDIARSGRRWWMWPGKMAALTLP